MKLSLKFRGNDDGDHHNNSSTQTQIMTAKVPITVFNYPLMSIITSTTSNTNKSSTSSDFTFSLSTNFPTGPTLRLSYSPSLTSSLPFSLSLKSGLSLFGSPRNSPLIFSANFPLSLSTTTSHTPPPSFFLHFKPQFGHFSLNKTVFSDDDNNNNNNNALPLSLPLDNPQIDKGFVASPYGSSSGWQNLNLEPYTTKESNNNGVVMTDMENNQKRGLSPALEVMARTVVPVTQGLLLNFRWGVNFMGKSGFKIPYLTVNKIGLERVEEVKQNQKKDIDEKGMLFGMRKELESVEKENREIKRVLDEIMKKGVSNSNSKSSTTTTREGKKRSDNEKVGNKQKNSFQHWDNNGNNEKNTVKQPNQNKPPPQRQSAVVVGSDLESELQKAIKAAASNSY